MKHIPRIGITQGDYNGVGLEVTLKALGNETILELMTPVLYADVRLLQEAAESCGLEPLRLNVIENADEASEGSLNVVDLALDDVTLTPGSPSEVSGRGAVASLRKATADVMAGVTDAIVTAPICKESVQSDDFRYSGHTEYLGAVAGEEYHPLMILFDDCLRVALVTTHLPLADIAGAVTEQKVIESITAFERSLREDFNIDRPRVAVLSLNPHAGDGGLLGREEQDVIIPAIENCYETGVLAFGPFAADGFFGSGKYRNFDGVLAMYHDQGLAPFKTIAGEHGVNYTAALPFVRTSPDHGTAFDIAWRNSADPTSMREAIYKAIDICRNRAIYKEASANPLKRETGDRVPRNERPERPVKCFDHREERHIPDASTDIETTES